NTARSQDWPLKATNVRGHHPGGEIGVLSESTVRTRPARLRGEVRHRVEGDTDTNSQVLLPGRVPELFHEPLVAGGGEAELFGPLGETASHKTRGRVVREGMSRVGRDR